MLSLHLSSYVSSDAYSICLHMHSPICVTPLLLLLDASEAYLLHRSHELCHKKGIKNQAAVLCITGRCGFLCRMFLCVSRCKNNCSWCSNTCLVQPFVNHTHCSFLGRNSDHALLRTAPMCSSAETHC